MIHSRELKKAMKQKERFHLYQLSKMKTKIIEGLIQQPQETILGKAENTINGQNANMSLSAYLENTKMPYLNWEQLSEGSKSYLDRKVQQQLQIATSLQTDYYRRQIADKLKEKTDQDLEYDEYLFNLKHGNLQSSIYGSEKSEIQPFMNRSISEESKEEKKGEQKIQNYQEWLNISQLNEQEIKEIEEQGDKENYAILRKLKTNKHLRLHPEITHLHVEKQLGGQYRLSKQAQTELQDLPIFVLEDLVDYLQKPARNSEQTNISKKILFEIKDIIAGKQIEQPKQMLRSPKKIKGTPPVKQIQLLP